MLSDISPGLHNLSLPLLSRILSLHISLLMLDMIGIRHYKCPFIYDVAFAWHDLPREVILASNLKKKKSWLLLKLKGEYPLQWFLWQN